MTGAGAALTVAPDAFSRRLVIQSLGVVLAVALALVGLDVYRIVFGDHLTPYERTRTCLDSELAVPVLRVAKGAPGSEAATTLRTIIETNVVTLAFPASAAEAAAVTRAGRSHGLIVQPYGSAIRLWSAPPSPTQLDTLADCSY